MSHFDSSLTKHPGITVLESRQMDLSGAPKPTAAWIGSSTTLRRTLLAPMLGHVLPQQAGVCHHQCKQRLRLYKLLNHPIANLVGAIAVPRCHRLQPTLPRFLLPLQEPHLHSTPVSGHLLQAELDSFVLAKSKDRF